MWKYAYLVPFVAFGIFSGHAQVLDPDAETKVRSFVRATMDCRDIPGLTLAVVKGNDTWMEGFGTADFETGRAVTNQTLFGIGSVTKSFTMTLLAILLDEHGFKWSSKVSDVMGSEFKFIDDVRTREMTIRDLLSHRTGLARLDIGLIAGYQHNLTDRARFSERIQFLPVAHEFRDRFLYNNFMYTLLGHITEVLGKDSWENLLQDRLLTPIGMTSTSVMRTPQDVLKEMSAKPYIYKDGTFQDGNYEIYDIFPSEPAGAILSTAEDMVKWIQFNMNDGQTENDVQLVKKAMLVEARSVVTPISTSTNIAKPTFPISELYEGYGYAWIMSNYRGYERYWHSGGLFSYVTYLWIFPEMKIGLFASVNGPAYKSGTALRSIFYYTSDILLQEETWLNETTTCTFPEPWKTEPSKNSSMEEARDLNNAHEYSGVFGNKLLPDVTISVPNNNEQNLRLTTNRVSGVLHPTPDKDRFLFEITAPWEFAIEFIDDDNITTLTNVTFLRNGGSITDAKFSYEVNVTYSKGISIVDPVTVTTSGANAPRLLKPAYIIVVIFCLSFNPLPAE